MDESSCCSAVSPACGVVRIRHFDHSYRYVGASQAAPVVKNLPANAGDARDAVRSLSQEDPPEKDMATHSSILPWRIPQPEEPGGLQSMGSQRVRHN